jgi:hypothetical protein
MTALSAEARPLQVSTRAGGPLLSVEIYQPHAPG